jgi:hypothetical protein
VAANTIAQVTLAVWAFLAIQRAKRPGFPVGDVARIGAAAALTLLAVSTTATATGHGVLSLVVGTAAGLVTYAAACILLGAVKPADWAVLLTSGRRIMSLRRA